LYALQNPLQSNSSSKNFNAPATADLRSEAETPSTSNVG